MASTGASKRSYKHSYEKCVSPGASNISLDESDVSVRTNDINMNANSYVNTPSPSSITSNSTINHSFKYRRSSTRNDYFSHMFSKHRYRYDRLFRHTQLLNRQYILTMTNALFNMQKEMYKLKRRTYHVEQMLAKQTQAGHPIIRIPRLTRDEISTICITDNEKEQNIISEETETIPIIKNDIQTPENKPEDTTESVTILETTNDVEEKIIPPEQEQQQQSVTKIKYCSTCDHDFSHRSAFLRHVRRIHKGIFPSGSDYSNPSEGHNSHRTTTTSLINDPPFIYSETENGIDGDEFQVINPWDIGEGRLRPRRASKLNADPISKVKCDICNKFYRIDYIKKHKKRTHGISASSPATDFNDISIDQPNSDNEKPSDELPTAVDESSFINTDPPSAVTIAEMDIDDMPIQFRKDSNKLIFIAATCLERYQLDILEEFLRKFSSRVSQTTNINSRTTHLITNDEQQSLRSPLSIKLIEAIANHCFCVSYRWLIDCLKYDRIVDESTYEIEGDNTDCHPHGGPKRSRLSDKRHALFADTCFMIKCAENSDIKMSNDRLQDLITSCGGQIITCVTQNLLDRFQIVVLCDRLYVSERRHNYEQCRALGIHFVSSDWVLESILEYRQTPMDSYKEMP